MKILSLRSKLLFFSTILALIPLGIAGRSLITITQDELKSSANDELSITAGQLAQEIDDIYINTWRAPLLLIRNAIDSEELGVQEKLSLLTGIKNIADVVSLQVTVEGVKKPILVTQNEFASRLKKLSLKPADVLKLSNRKINKLKKKDEIFIGDLTYLPKVDVWLVSMVIPLKKISGRKSVLAARINLDSFKNKISKHPFANTGFISVIDSDGRKIFERERTDLSSYEVVQKAKEILKRGSRAIGVFPYTRPSGEKMLGAHAFPSNFNWGIIVEKRESDAYLAVAKMVKSLIIWVLIGFSVAVVGAMIFSQGISSPILKIGEVAQAVGTGDFNVRVPGIKSRDEISDLGNRMNEMIEGLHEKFQLQKFVSTQTIDAIKHSDEEGIKLGGERKNATVFFSDIRGFTSFSEKVEPEVVIEMLNTYLRAQAKIVKEHKGDIDKFVGDELVAVFQGEEMVRNAVVCAIDIQKEIVRLNEEHPEWNIAVGIGINTGDMIMGAMGSEERMDYTILGDNVNLGARLCSNAKPRQIIISEVSYREIAQLDIFEIEDLEPINVKGKEKPIQIYGVVALKQT